MEILGRAFDRASAIGGWAAGSAPPERGIYAICRTDGVGPEILERSPAGWWKGKDPTIDRSRLSARWIEGSNVLYLGAADNLRDRIDLLVSFGMGCPVMHWGGRALWQLTGILRADLYWSRTFDDCERCVENELLRVFRAKYDGYPFANLSGPRHHLKCRRLSQ
jgi:hypothetical protein